MVFLVNQGNTDCTTRMYCSCELFPIPLCSLYDLLSNSLISCLEALDDYGLLVPFLPWMDHLHNLQHKVCVCVCIGVCWCVCVCVCVCALYIVCVRASVGVCNNIESSTFDGHHGHLWSLYQTTQPAGYSWEIADAMLLEAS